MSGMGDDLERIEPLSVPELHNGPRENAIGMFKRLVLKEKKPWSGGDCGLLQTVWLRSAARGAPSGKVYLALWRFLGSSESLDLRIDDTSATRSRLVLVTRLRTP